jgi:hypothetical protein
LEEIDVIDPASLSEHLTCLPEILQSYLFPPGLL